MDHFAREQRRSASPSPMKASNEKRQPPRSALPASAQRKPSAEVPFAIEALPPAVNAPPPWLSEFAGAPPGVAPPVWLSVPAMPPLALVEPLTPTFKPPVPPAA